ncbi:hypothetical protein [Rhizobium sp. HT1-10]
MARRLSAHPQSSAAILGAVGAAIACAGRKAAVNAAANCRRVSQW